RGGPYGRRVGERRALYVVVPCNFPPPPFSPPMEPTPVPSPSPDPSLVERVRGLAPTVRGLIGKVRAVGAASAVAAVVLWAILFGASAWPISAEAVLAYVALAVLLVPAAGTFAAVLTLRDVLALPDRLRAVPGALRESAVDVKEHAASVVRP